ncbi:MAG: stage III sporulation protein AB [Clostridiales bacterium]|nr:stage III sporulation protein AB [Clostridiales bacterium]
MKFIGAILLITAATGTGLYFSERLRARCNAAREIILMCELIEIEMQFNLNCVGDIFEKIVCTADFKSLSFIRKMDKTKPFYTAFCNALDQSTAYIDRRDRASLKQLAAFLGSTDVQTQLSYLGAYKASMHKRLSYYEAEEKRLAKLYVAFGLFGGCAAVVIFL